MTPQQLRNSILQLAIEGKLVGQRPEEGTGEALYQLIEEQKKDLIKAGKIKRQKALPEITEAEIPFEIPHTWKWVRLKQVVYHRGQKKPASKFWYIDIGSIDNINQKLKPLKNIIDAESAPSRARRIVGIGDILYSTVRPYLHNMCIIDSVAPVEIIASTGLAAMTCYEKIFNKYLFYYLLSPSFDRYANSLENSKGVAYPAINDERLYKAVVPLPPFDEQKRIVEKIEAIFPLIDIYGNAWQKLDKLNKKFPADIQNSILQESIQGKLVEQRYNEGTGEELYQVIKEWKKRLCESGEIKKEKEQPPIAADEVPFAIPKTWTWGRLADVGDWRAGATPSRTNPNYYGGEIPWLKTGDLTDGDIQEASEYITDLALKETSVRLNPEGSVLMAMYGATIGKLGILTKPMTTNQACCACIVSPYLFNKYLFFFLMSNRKEFIKKGEGGAQPNISRTKIIETCMPLPPFKEQCRIVKKLEGIGLLINQYQKLFRKV